ncbi:SET and MYND domain-containing protein 4 [Battus philenor]|uniref:SET and MYND domain-containing protein 4 n=1 Tax=Battus philenor TaxID=42288 RepID=UPI0035CFF754
MIIDNLYESVIRTLTTQGKIVDISNKLASQKNNNDRVLYVYKLLQELGSIPEINEVNKSDTVSIHYRNQGNKCFQSRKLIQAWQYYNLALLHAPKNSNSYCLALSNRSAVLQHMTKYEECVKDINTIFSMKYPLELKEKLIKRKKFCEDALLEKKSHKNEDNSNLTNMLHMNSSKDSRYLSASSKLEVVFTKDMGRQVVAKEDVNVGEVLVEEDPYFILIMKSHYLFCCHYCLSRDLNLFPCDDCCYTFYCSTECKDNAFKDYHAVECKLMAVLFDMDFTKLELLALRTVIKARNDHKDWKSLFKTIDEAEANIDNEYRGHIQVNGKWILDSKHYASIHTLESNVNKRSVSDIFQKAVTAAVFLKFLSCDTKFLQVEDAELSESVTSCVAGLLLLHLMTSAINMHGISANIETEGIYVEDLSIASAPYGFHSLLNHSCAPNVVRINKLGSGRMYLFALRPIKKGMQIFDNYGAHHAIHDCQSRRASLKFQYKFDCICEACINDWPTYFGMGPSTHVPTGLVDIKIKLLDENVIGKLQRGDVVTAHKVFKSLCSLCQALEPYAPCTELSDCQEALKQCLVIFSGLLSCENKILIPWTPLPPIL